MILWWKQKDSTSLRNCLDRYTAEPFITHMSVEYTALYKQLKFLLSLPGY